MLGSGFCSAARPTMPSKRESSQTNSICSPYRLHKVLQVLEWNRSWDAMPNKPALERSLKLLWLSNSRSVLSYQTNSSATSTASTVPSTASTRTTNRMWNARRMRNARWLPSTGNFSILIIQIIRYFLPNNLNWFSLFNSQDAQAEIAEEDQCQDSGQECPKW